MARVRLGLLGALLLLAASLWFAPGGSGARFAAAPGLVETADLVSSQGAGGGHFTFAEALGDEPDDDDPPLPGMRASVPPAAESQRPPAIHAASADGRAAPRATGPPA